MRAWLFFGSVVVTGTVLDQLTKRWAEAELQGGNIMLLVPQFLDLRYVRNPGAFFSLGASWSPDLRRACFVVASLGVLALIAAFYRQLPASQWRSRAALALLASGALGNAVDRVARGEVVDFVHMHAGAWFSWAIFNLADVLITVGLGLLVLDRLRPAIVEKRVEGLAQTVPLDGGY
jgi:signal peptidase II